ncbi:MAG: hypothetical protein HOV81_25290 [Kofleriaceae bacterium]|nr:hypothetical protein [Kofleriaceae bacterium]
MVKSKHGLSRLLAGRDRLSRLEKEHILDQVLAQTAPPRRTRWWLAAMPAVAAAVTILLVLAPWHREPEFAARGGNQAVGAFKPTCAHGCGTGDKIVFDLAGTTGYRYFAAFSQRADGTVLWYFPGSDADTSVELAQGLGSGVLDRGIVIGSEHPAGTYRVYGVFSTEPLSRKEIRDRFDDVHVTAGPGTSVVVQELVVR